MTSDKREDWIEHILSEADVAVTEAQSPLPETPETPSEQLEGGDKDFTSRSG
jgi:hypothetical protein